MNGLLKNNFYASWDNAKWFAAVMTALGIAVVIAEPRGPLIGYLLVSMIGFSASGLGSLRKEGASKWGKYKLTLPVRRRQIVGSYFLTQLLWLAVGMLFAGAAVGASLLLHGYVFDLPTDVLMLFTTGIGVSLWMGAFFFPLFYLGGEERSEVVLITSLLDAAGVLSGLIYFLNWLFGPKQTLAQLLISAGVLLGTALLAYGVSYAVSVKIFGRKNY